MSGSLPAHWPRCLLGAVQTNDRAPGVAYSVGQVSNAAISIFDIRAPFLPTFLWSCGAGEGLGRVVLPRV